jgi:cellulose 1,4-beta-cellobiosidase
MLKIVVLTGVALAAASVVSTLPANAALTAPHVYYPHVDHSLTLCGTHDHTPVGPSDNSVQVRNTFWKGTGPTCIRTPSNGGAGFTVTRTPRPTSPRQMVTTYPSIFRGCIWDMCTKNTSLPARADHLRSVVSSWSTISTHRVTKNVRVRATRKTRCLPGSRRTVTVRHGRTRTKSTTCAVRETLNVALPGTYNTSYDLWFGKHSMTQGHADGAELMVWLNHRGGCCILRRGAPIVRINGVRYYFQYWHPSDPDYPGLSWNYIQFRRVVQTTQVTNLNLTSFVRFAEQAHRGLGQPKALISPRWWLENAGGGFEIWNGGLGLRTTSFVESIATD